MSKFRWNFRDWSLDRVRSTLHYGELLRWTEQVFAFRCSCGQFTLGCKDHWFCGLCEACRTSFEDDNDAS